MKSRLIFHNKDQNLIQAAVDQQKQKGIRDITYHSSSNLKEAKNLLDDCIKQRVSKLIILEFTVFGTRQIEIIKTLSRLFSNGIQVDLYTCGRTITLDSFACFSEEIFLILHNNLSSIHRSKIKIGQSIAKSNGKKIGRKSYISTDLIKSMRNEGLSIRDIANQTGVSVTSVWRHAKEVSGPDTIPRLSIEN